MKKNLLLSIGLLVISFSAIFAQKTVTGKVTDDTGAGLPGVNILLKGTTIGTVTDAYGQYSLSVQDTEYGVLVFSFIGYLSEEVSIGSRSVVDITMAPDIQTLSEVVVVGYGTMRREDISGAVASVQTKDLPKVANPSIDQLLQGRVPGLNIVQRSAQPGGGLNINVRNAISPLGNNAPLYVIDGVPVFNNTSAERPLSEGNIGFGGGVDRNPLNSINPSDIESIDVLKDASATAIYGANAANGVILITTKRGRQGAPTVDYRGSYTIQTPKKYIDVFNAREFMQQHNRLAHDLYLYDNDLAPYGDTAPSTVTPFAPTFSNFDIQSAGEGTDWLDMLIRDGRINEHNVSIAAGTENSKIYTAFNYFNNQGILENSDFTRYTGRINLDQKIGKKVNFSLNVTASQVDNSNVTSGANAGGVEKYNMLQSAFAFSPTRSIYDENGEFTKSFDTQITNPAAFLIMSDNSATSRIIVSPNVEIKILDELKLNVVTGADRQNAQRDFYLPRAVRNFQLPEGMAQKSNSNISNYTGESYLTFNKTFGQSTLGVVAGAGIYKTTTNRFEVEAVNFPTDAFGDNNLGSAIDLARTVLNSERTERKRFSQFFRVNYSFNEKYILTVTGRRDGDSYFAPNNKYGFFPGVSAAWRINSENFLLNQDLISDLKLRAGAGQSGNATLNGNWLALYGGQYPYPIGGVLHTGVTLTQLENPDLTWETNETLNIGLDFGLWSNRVSGSIDVYRRSAKDLLAYTTLPFDGEVNNYLVNNGTTRSEGIELMITSVNVDGELTWSTTVNASTSRSFWVDGNPAIATNPWIKNGDPFTAIYGWKTDGIIQSASEKPAHMPDANPGNIRYVDHNSDGVLDSKDIVILGQRAPKWNLGLANTFTWKNFDLNLFIYAFVGNNASINSIGRGYDPANPGQRLALGNIQNTPVDIRRVWTADNPTGDWPGLAVNPYTGSNPSSNPAIGNNPEIFPGTENHDFYLQKANFARIKNITLGYTFSPELTGRTFIRTARIFIDVQNLAQFTNFDGLDPEITEVNPYPQTLSTTLGVNVGF